MVHSIQRRQRVARPLDEVFAFFADARNLDLLTPAWLRFRVITPPPIEMRPGALIEYSIRWHGLPLRWLTRIEEWTPPHGFVDVQLRGPYRQWHHTHRFTPDGDGVIIEDVVRYALPLGPLGRLAHALAVRRDIERIFDFRRVRIGELFPAAVRRAPVP